MKTIFKQTILIIVFHTGTIITTNAQNYLDIIDFETGDFSQWRVKCSGCKHEGSTSPTIVTSPTRGGNYAGKYLEISGRTESSSEWYPRDTELWAGWALYIPDNFPQTDSKGAHVSQFHASQPGDCHGDANFFIELKNEDDDGKTPEWGYWLKSAGIRSEFNRPVQTGEWTEFVMHVNWTHTNKGYIEIWIRDSQGETKYTIVSNSPTYYGGSGKDCPRGPYFKAGVYSAGAVEDAYSYVDEFRIIRGSDGGYDDVSPAMVLKGQP